MSDWKTKTCENCEFMVDKKCLKHPPSVFMEDFPDDYPNVFKSNKYYHACSEYKEKNDK